MESEICSFWIIKYIKYILSLSLIFFHRKFQSFKDTKKLNLATVGENGAAIKVVPSFEVHKCDWPYKINFIPLPKYTTSYSRCINIKSKWMHNPPGVLWSATKKALFWIQKREWHCWDTPSPSILLDCHARQKHQLQSRRQNTEVCLSNFTSKAAWVLL